MTFAVTLPRRHFAELVPSLGGEDNLEGWCRKVGRTKVCYFFFPHQQ